MYRIRFLPALFFQAVAKKMGDAPINPYMFVSHDS